MPGSIRLGHTLVLRPLVMSAHATDEVPEDTAQVKSHLPPTPGQPYIIKKYPNRRLYDTTTSSYITLAQVKRLVMQHYRVVVRDARTDEDLTRSILLQIILEEEAGGQPMFSETMLANIIRFYGHAMQSQLGRYIENNVQMLTDIQKNVASHTGDSSQAWIKMLQSMQVQHPLLNQEYSESMKKMQEQFQKNAEALLDIFSVKY